MPNSQVVTVVVTQASTVWVKPTPVVKVASAAAAGLQAPRSSAPVLASNVPLVKVAQASAEPIKVAQASAEAVSPVASTSRAAIPAPEVTVQATSVVLVNGSPSTTTAVATLHPIVLVTTLTDGSTSTITAAAVFSSPSAATPTTDANGVAAGTAPFNLSSALKIAPTSINLDSNQPQSSAIAASPSSSSGSSDSSSSGQTQNSNFFASLGRSPVSITLTPS